jgi:hypothetical protein
MICLVCKIPFQNSRSLSRHIIKSHNISSEEYTIEFIYSGERPHCRICNNSTRYSSFTFKEYCKEHSHYAMKSGGSKGGKYPSWNKGLTKETDARIKKVSESITGENNPFYGKSHTLETRERISQLKSLSMPEVERRLLERSDCFDIEDDLNDYSSRQSDYIQIRCKECGNLQRKTLQTFERGSLCTYCTPVRKSQWELEIFNWVSTLCPDAISGDRTVVPPKEIDVYVPSKNFGIECHGLYWHSEIFHTGKDTHQRKYRETRDKGVRLLQLFDDEWRDKREICQSLIRNRLGMNLRKIRSSDCILQQLNPIESRTFFNSTHISGHTSSHVTFGLKTKGGEIVAALSLRIPRHKNKYKNSLEVARFSTVLNTTVHGGLTRLVRKAIEYCKSSGFSSIMTYVDQRIGSGAGYVTVGFSLIGETGPDYWYTDCRNRFNRFKFRATAGKSEKEIAAEANVFKIYGCGSKILELKTS